MRLSKKQETYFFSKLAIQANGCLEWMGSRHKLGYGRYHPVIGDKDYEFTAHRIAYTLAHNLDLDGIPEDKVVRHKCDNPSCTLPSHLELGTKADNSRDMVEHGRTVNRKGESNTGSKLTDKIVLECRRLNALDPKLYSYAALGRTYKADEVTIASAIKKISWKHV